MKKLKTYAQKKPILILLLLMIFALIVFYAPTEKLYLHFYNIKYSTFLAQLTNDMIVSIVLIIVLIKLYLIKGTGITVFPNSWKDWFIAWPLMIILLLSFLPLITGGITINTNPSIVSIFIIMNFFVGLAEELLFRGVILSLLLIKWGNTRKGIYISVIVSSVMFGSAHIGNFIANQNILLSTLSQLVSGTLIGIFFAACVLRSETIWPAIILHATVDFIGQIQQIAMGLGLETVKQAVDSISLKQALEPIGLYLILASYAFFILKKVTPADVQSKLSSNFLRK